MDQLPLIHEDFRSALRHAVDALGGPSKVGLALWPTKSVADARSALNNCLNPDRAEKLDLEEIQWILAEARKLGCHAAMAYLAAECGYSQPTPVTPEDEQDELMRQFIAAQKIMSRIVQRLDSVAPKLQAVKS